MIHGPRRKSSMLREVMLVALAMSACLACAQPVREPSRGELLYSTHCIACHSTEVHWRDKRLAKDWATLQAEVRRWQRVARLGWNDEDIAAVTRYLNTLHYHYPPPY